MKSRGTYTITNAEEGKAAQLDQSFRSCLMALLIFFFMCMIMLLTLLFAQKSGMSYTTTEKQTAMQLQDDANGGTELVIDDPDNEPSYNNYHPAPPKKTATTTESFQLPPTEPSSTETYTTSTEQSTLTSSAEYPLVDIEQTTSFHETSSPTSEFTTSRASDSTDKVQIFADTTENFESTSNEWQSSSTEIVTSTSYDDLTTDNSMWSSPQNYIELNNVDDCLLRCRGTDFGSTTPSDVPTDEKQVKKWNILEESMSPTVEKKEEETISDCNDGQCKRVASKILSYMDHEGSPCVDFYEYACGGLEADYQISEKDLSRRAYETVKRQAEQERNNPRYAQFIRYYDSCLNYEVTDSISERIRLVKKALEKIGKFYTQTEWGNRTEDFTEMFANMMKNNWPLLFDIVPDVNKKNPEIFTLTIGPRQLVFENKSLQFPHDSDPCENEKEEAMSLQRTIDLDIQYRKYEDCKTDTKRFVTSIRQTLSDLHIFDSLTNSGNISQNIELTINAIDIDIIEGIIKKYSSERQIYEDYRSKNYSIMQLSDLQGDRTLINWTQLIRSLTGSDLGNDASVYVYKKDELIEAMKKLEELGKTSPYNLNNALLGLYAHYLYNNFVTPKSPRDLHNDCLYKGVHLMKDLASEIYMRSFTDHEVEHMRNVMKNHFVEMKKTLQLNIKQAKWASELDQQSLLKKLDHMKISLPFSKNNTANELDINLNYFENSMNLMKKYRTMMYSMTKKKPIDQIWKFFASPFDSTAQTIYALNLIVIPYGAVEVDMKTYGSTVTKENINYLTLATIGNVIARQIAQNFDMTGIRYLNGFVHEETKNTFDEYIQCHETLYDGGMYMTLSEALVHFNVPTLSLNERLSDIVGLRLARDTLDRLSLESTRPLPWLNLDVAQLFYLTYVQTHCTKAPLTSSHISLHEDPFLPGRIRVHVASNNNNLFTTAWRCLLSEKAPPSVCLAFPHLDNIE